MFVGKIDHVYRVVERLGEGLNGEVFKVEGPEGTVGLKLLKKEAKGLTPQEHISLFKFEFSLLKGLAHPHIIQIRDFGYDANLDRFYYTQEWVQGKTLDEWDPAAPLPKLQRLFLQSLQGLAYLHRQSVLHGDLSPKNLLVVDEGADGPSIKIIDFGLSGRMATGGTPGYMAPEKILNEPIDARSDLYSLGVVFYTRFTGKNPFLRNNLPATLQAHLKFVPPAATAVRPQLDPVWSRLLDWMLQKNPRNRVESAEACLEFLEGHGLDRDARARPRRLQKAWIDRCGFLQRALRFLDRLGHAKKPRALLLLGPLNLGQAELMTELKYEAELRDIRVSRAQHPRGKGPALRLETWGFEDSPPPLKLPLAGNESLILAAPLSRAEELRKKLRAYSPQTVVLRPLSPKALEKYLQEITGQAKIPASLLKTLWGITRGCPDALYPALQRLAQDPSLVDVTGRWQLGVLSEMPAVLEDVLFGERLPALPLTPDLKMDPKMGWLVSFYQARTWAKEEKYLQALERLAKLEKDLLNIFSKQEGSRLYNRYYALLMKAFGWIYSKQGRLAEAREAFSAGLARLREDSDQDRLQGIRLRNYLGFLDLQEGRIQESIRTFTRTAREAERLDAQSRRLITNNELGAAYLAAGEYSRAVKILEEDLRFFGESGNPQVTMKIAYGMGAAYAKLGNYREARRAFERTTDLARRERNWDFLYRGLNGLGNVAKLQNRLEEALDFYRRSLILVEYRGDYLAAATVSQNRGVILSEMGRLDEALRDLEHSRQLVANAPRSFHGRCLLARTFQEIGVVHQKMGNFEQAKIHFSEARSRAEEEPLLKDFRFYPLFSLAELALVEGKGALYRDYHAEAVHWADTSEKRAKLAELEARKSAYSRLEGVGRAPSETGAGFKRGAAIGELIDINRDLLREEDPSLILKKILRSAAELSGAETVLLLESRDEGKWRLLEFMNAPADREEIALAGRLAGRALASRRTLRAADAGAEEPFRRDPAVLASKLRSMACIPVEIPDRAELCLYLSHHYQIGLFTEEKLTLLEAFAVQAALALRRGRGEFIPAGGALPKGMHPPFPK